MEQKELNIDEQGFFNAIGGIDPLYLQEKSYQQIIYDGLEAFRKIPGCNYAALFCINLQNFDFDFEESTGGVTKEEAEGSYKYLVDNGGIASVLSSGEIIFWQVKYETRDDDFLIIPLIVQSGITGLLILSLNESFTGNENITELCRIYSNYFALLMQNHDLVEEIQNIKLQSEQKITSRTDKIVKSTRELKSILDTVQAGIIIIDKDNLQIADANLAAIQLAGVVKEDILGTDIKALFISKDDGVESDKTVTNREELLRRKDGTLIPVIKTVADINLGGEEFIIATFLDITKRKLMEDALREAHDKLEQRVEERTIELSIANQELQKEINERIKIEQELIAAKEKAELSDKLKSNILANMQHEFRTPLIGIQGFSKILMEESSNGEHRDLSKYIFSCGQRLLNTLNSVLFMSRFESESISVKLDNFNIFQKLNTVFEQFEIAANEKNLEFKVYNIDNISADIDPDLLSQSITNLLDNAVKFTKKGGISITIAKTKENDKDWAVIKINDTGIGIKESEQSVIFNSFRQASEGFNREYEGNGLGLTLAKKMIEMMGGKITLDSKLNFGSTFIVWIPL
jgi:PAS domain S-box-containing protein